MVISMLQRFIPWLLFCAFFASVVAHAQTAGKKGVFDPNNNAGQILVAKVSGKVTKTLNNVVSDLKFEEVVEQLFQPTDARGQLKLRPSMGTFLDQVSLGSIFIETLADLAQ